MVTHEGKTGFLAAVVDPRRSYYAIERYEIEYLRAGALRNDFLSTGTREGR